MAFKFLVKQNPLAIEFEAGSIKEGLAVLESEENALGQFFAKAAALASEHPVPLVAVTNDVTVTGELPKKRGRPAKDAKDAAPVTVAAPAPIPVPTAPPIAPAAPPAPPVAPGADGLDVPAFLDRRGGAATTTTAPPPPPPPPPPAASSNFNTALAEAVEKALRARPGFETDKGASLASWLITNGVKATAGSTFDEVAVVLKFTDQGVLNPIADALGVAG